MNTCNICFDYIDHEIYQCKLKCNSFYHFECALNWAYKVNTCPFCRSSNFYKLPNLDKFYEYCKEGNLEEIKKLNLNIEDIRSHTSVVTESDTRSRVSEDNDAFKSACFKGHIEVVKYLIDKGLTLKDITSSGGASPKEMIRSDDNEAFRWASYYGHFEVVNFLINT